MTSEDSVSVAAEAWLASKASLAPRTKIAYQGEAGRFTEFLGMSKVHRIGQLTREHWWDYLKELRGDRHAVRSKRQEALSDQSIIQAQRITRNFLLWAQDRGLLAWSPNAPSLPLPGLQSSREEVKLAPADAWQSLQAMATRRGVDHEVQLRAELVMNLLFWAALKPSELVALKANDFRLDEGPVGLLQVVGRRVAIYVPCSLWDLWQRYQEARQKRTVASSLSSEEPLICSLNSRKPISPWTVWSIVKEIGPDLRPGNLRSSYLDLITKAAAGPLCQARTVTGMPKLSPVFGSGSTADIQAIGEALVQAQQALGLKSKPKVGRRGAELDG